MAKKKSAPKGVEYLLRSDRTILVDAGTINALLRELETRDTFLIALYSVLSRKEPEELTSTELETKLRIGEFYAGAIQARDVLGDAYGKR